MAPLRVGIIGCGGIARSVHLPILRALPGAELVALAETDSARLHDASRHVPGAARFADYRELLRLRSLDAVVICVPTALHAQVALAAFQHRKHVYLEKPVATCLADALEVLEAQQRAGVVGMVGFNYRFNPLYEAARRQIAAGRLGELVSAHSVFAASAPGLPAWKHARASGGGVLLDLACHHVDLVRFFFSQEVSAVSAHLRSQRSDGDSAAVQLRLAGGLLVQSFFSLCAVEEDRFEVYGRAGKLTVDRYWSLDVEISESIRRAARLKRWVRSVQSVARLPYLIRKMREPCGEPSYRTALRRFVAAARSGSPASPDLLDGCRSLAVIEAAEQSAAHGRTIVVPEAAGEAVCDPPLAVSAVGYPSGGKGGHEQ
jgi:predicted dehydrogenase